MAGKASLYDLRNQPPVIQLFTSALIVILIGTLIFYLFVFGGTLIFRTNIAEMLKIPPADAGLREGSILKYIQVSQQIALFIIPAIVIALLLRRHKDSFLKTDKLPGSTRVIMVVFLALLIIPVASYTGMLNSKMNLPEWVTGMEKWMRAKEDIASGLTALLIKSSGLGDLVINIFVLAVVPAVGEEMIFRGVLQQILCRIFKSDHTGIWITAVLFSAIHLQFFGFLPRVILGLCFGYLFFWTGNLWLPVIAHFINNAVPVVISYFVGWSELSDKATVIAEKEIMLPLSGAFLSIGILFYFWSEYRKDFVETS